MVYVAYVSISKFAINVKSDSHYGHASYRISIGISSEIMKACNEHAFILIVIVYNHKMLFGKSCKIYSHVTHAVILIMIVGIFALAQ